MLFVSMPAAWQHVKAGKLKAIAVTSAKRSADGAGRADDRRVGRPGFRRRFMVWLARAGKDAARGRRPTERGVREGAAKIRR